MTMLSRFSVACQLILDIELSPSRKRTITYMVPREKSFPSLKILSYLGAASSQGGSKSLYLIRLSSWTVQAAPLQHHQNFLDGTRQISIQDKRLTFSSSSGAPRWSVRVQGSENVTPSAGYPVTSPPWPTYIQSLSLFHFLNLCPVPRRNCYGSPPDSLSVASWLGTRDLWEVSSFPRHFSSFWPTELVTVARQITD